MKILITNDDGIMAPGIQALAGKFNRMGEIYLIAPYEEQSASGHGITIIDPIRVRQMEFPGIKEAWAIMGTPADCVKLAVQELINGQCDLVISGINNGPNLGTDVLYSGTVSAAIEGAILGVPAMAVSLAKYGSVEYDSAAEIALKLAKHLYLNRKSVPPDTLLNINIPDMPGDIIKGLKITRLGIREYENVFERRTDPRGNLYYWLKGDIIPNRNHEHDIDVVAVEEGYVSVSPIHFDLTNYKIIEKIKSWGFENIAI